ncbi:DEAD/DEAH box helicase [Spiroplasma endosymbiont of Eupeodes luniger]|uniref:DEAD/DEAH box helicase n=1 Tax=Spiroplasma endosymbiont of Eupeodes luniger TaxID=3066300 RepID=UPI0030D51CCB
MRFQDIGLSNEVLATIDSLKFVAPTNIQKKMLPLMVKGQNVIVSANTGTGKTVGYLLAVLSKINPTINKTQAIIIVPTRELAVQIYNVSQKFIKNNPNLKIANLIGGQDLEQQKQKFNTNYPHLVIGTPTRLKRMIDEQALALTTSKMVVLDEVDMVFDLDFVNEVDFLLSKLASNTQFMVFSATINNELQNFLKKYLKNTTIFDLSDYKIQTNIEHFLVKTRYRNRIEILKNLLTTVDPFLCLIFVNKKEDMNQVLDLLQEQNIKAGQIHSSLKSRERIKMLKRINNLEFKFVVCSDIASRGIDLTGVSHVISLNLPYDLTYYFHRAGRTGRGKYHGYSYLFYDSSDEEGIAYLTKKGINFTLWNEKVKKPTKKVIKSIPQASVNDLQKVISKYHSQPIKPGYKKQRKEEVKKVIQKYRKKSFKK